MCKKLIYLTAFALVLGLCLTSSVQAGNIIWVTKTQDHDFDGIQDDQGFIDWLVAEGHTVDVRMDYWTELDPNKVDELNTADLVIMSRSTSSGDHDDGDEPGLWNSIASPMILMNGYIVRSNRWRWMDTTSIVKGDDRLLLALDPNHPLFDGVTLEGGYIVIFRDNTVRPGITSFVGSIDVGNGTLIAQTFGADQTWIAEWPAGVEFYPGSGQTAGGPRLLFVAGTQEEGPTPQGAWDLTADGEQMLRNAIAYMLPEPAGPKIIWVTEACDDDLDGIQDDRGWIDWLAAEGYPVSVRIDYWLVLDAGKVDELNAADLVIVSRSATSGGYDDSDEPTLWNSVTTPLMTFNVHLTRSNRWLWINSTSVQHLNASMMTALVLDHPVFDGVTLDPNNQVQALDVTVGMGVTSFVDTLDVGNGVLIAQSADELPWIAEWEAGVEFYNGAGQIPAGKRMMFGGGTLEDTTVGAEKPQGAMNLTAEGQQIFLNAIAYMLAEPAEANIIWVTKTQD
jgi:hypothetical protein